MDSKGGSTSQRKYFITDWVYLSDFCIDVVYIVSMHDIEYSIPDVWHPNVAIFLFIVFDKQEGWTDAHKVLIDIEWVLGPSGWSESIYKLANVCTGQMIRWQYNVAGNQAEG